jgi:hypothetical protein
MVRNKPLYLTLLALVVWQGLVGSSVYIFTLSVLLLIIVELEKMKKQKKKKKEIKILREKFNKINKNFECMLVQIVKDQKKSNNDDLDRTRLSLFKNIKKGGIHEDEPLSSNESNINDC